MPPMEWPTSTGVVHVGHVEDGCQIVRHILNRQWRRPPCARPVSSLVVEHHAESLRPEPAGDGQPDLVAAAPAVGEDDDRRIGPVALEIPQRQPGPVRRSAPDRRGPVCQFHRPNPRTGSRLRVRHRPRRESPGAGRSLRRHRRPQQPHRRRQSGTDASRTDPPRRRKRTVNWNGTGGPGP